MKSSYIAFAVPFFFLFIGLELAVARVRRRSVYRAGDAMGDLGCGMLQQALLVFLAGTALSLYVWVYEKHRLVGELPAPAAWALAMIGVDFLYYWWHRMSHEVAVLWAAHVVHHQSEDYNLAVALRQSILTSFTTVPFYLPLAFLGVSPLIFASANAISTLYQFWIHTELVGKLGWLEEWLNTASHHRVHHAINLRYLDKNYGAILIVWDRLFGTFEREDEAPVYGIIKPFHSYNPVWAQIEPVLSLVERSARAPRFGDKIRVWFASPSFTPEGLPPYPGLADGSYVDRPKYDPKARPGVLAYVMIHFTIVIAITATLMFEQETAPRPLLAAGVVLVLVTLGTMAGIFEGRRWARPVEAVRLVGVLGLLAGWKLLA